MGLKACGGIVRWPFLVSCRRLDRGRGSYWRIAVILMCRVVPLMNRLLFGRLRLMSLMVIRYWRIVLVMSRLLRGRCPLGRLGVSSLIGMMPSVGRLVIRVNWYSFCYRFGVTIIGVMLIVMMLPLRWTFGSTCGLLSGIRFLILLRLSILISSM